MEGQNNSLDNNASPQQETDSNKSFVTKVKSHVSELLSTSFGKWFSGENSTPKPQSNIRHRGYDDDDDLYQIQPPTKRVKMPDPKNRPSVNSISTTDFNNFSHISPTVFEPVAGPSGLQGQTNRLPTVFNGDKDSESCESDISLLPKFKNSTQARTNFRTPTTSPNRSLFQDRTTTSHLNTSLRTKLPSFDASTFGSPSFVDRTLSTKQILSSPFYAGRTVYGGASAYSGSRRHISRRPKSHIEVKPIDNSVGKDVSLSRTARRILTTLEDIDPVMDVKKIPYPKAKSRSTGVLSKYTGVNPYLPRERKAKPPSALNNELLVPTVPDLLKMKLKERLQDSTVVVRHIASTSNSVLNRDDYKVRSKEDEVPKHSNKMKNKLNTTRVKFNNQHVEEVKLPTVALPITNLPKFDFSLPPPPSSSKQPLITVACNESPKPLNTTPIATPVVKKAIISDSKDNETQFEFSNPLILADNLKSIIAINDFKFSDPLFKQKDKPDSTMNFKTSTPETFTLKRKNVDPPPVVPKLYKGSIEELFSKPTVVESLEKFKPAAALWECNVCLIRNAPEKFKCAACEAPKPSSDAVAKSNSVPKTMPSFGEQFKPSSSTWECPTCLIRNKNEDAKCVACETIKPSSKTVTPVVSGFGDVFKKQSNEWECSVCMIRNKDSIMTCQACETPKPGAKVEVVKPAQEKTEKIAAFTFGILPASASVMKTMGNETVPTPVLSSSFPKEQVTVIQSTAPSTVPTFSFGIPATQTVTVKDKSPEPVVPKVAKVIEKPPQPTNAAVSSPMFSFTAPTKPNTVNAVTASSIQQETSKPIVISTSSSAFTFNKSPKPAAPSLKRSADDAVDNKKLPIPITFEPPAINSLSPPTSIVPIRSSDKLFDIGKPTVCQPPMTSASFVFTPSTTQAQPAATTTTAGSNLFTFGATKTTSQSLFGNTSTTTQAPAFKFPQADPPAFGTTEKQSTPAMFGSPSLNSMFGSPKSSFETPSSTPLPFGAAAPITFTTDSPKPQSVFGGVEPKQSLFGSDQKSQPFGSVAEQKAPMFGAETKTQSIFGAEQKPAFGPTETKPFTFGGSVATNDTASKQSLFSFGAKSPEPNKPFNFSPAPAAGGFNFNANATSTFNFSAPPKVENNLPFQSPPALNNIFNPQPVQQTQLPLQNGGFNFGTPTNASNGNKTGFNFGATNQFAAAAPPQSTAAPSPAGFWGMANNANANPAPAAGGFNFGQAAPQAQAPPSFNANIKPNFNFTAGTTMTAFSATAESSPVTQRRRLKAVRRNPR